MTRLDALIERQKASGTYPTHNAGMERRELMENGTAGDEYKGEVLAAVKPSATVEPSVLPAIGIPLAAPATIVEANKETIEALQPAFALPVEAPIVAEKWPNENERVSPPPSEFPRKEIVPPAELIVGKIDLEKQTAFPKK